MDRRSRFIFYSGILLFSLGFIKPASAAVAPVEKYVPPFIPEFPVQILVPEVKINLYVENSLIKDGTWQVSDTSATYGKGSSPLNQDNGKTIIFAHAKDSIFGNLRYVNHKNEIIIYGDQNKYIYRIVNIEKIFPNDVNKLSNSGADLILLTCAGFNDEYRLFVQAYRSEVINLHKKGVT